MSSTDYYLMPCSGRSRLDIPRGHVYSVMVIVDSKKEYRGFITKDSAKKIIGEENYTISSSDSLCPLCSKDIDNDLGLELIISKEDLVKKK